MHATPGSTLAPGTQQLSAEALLVGQQQQQALLAYVPPELATLLKQLAADLAQDVQDAAAGQGGVSYDVAASALQVRAWV